jgi:DNA repair protein RadC
MKHPPARGLYVAEPDGSYASATDAVIIRAAGQAVTRAFSRGPCFGTPATARKLLPAMLGAHEYEVFCIAHLDMRHRLIHFEEMFRGTVDGASVHPREVVRSVMKWNSASVIAIHNHPSGDPEPSLADELITRRLKETLALIDVRMLDHLIVGGDSVVSLAERGLI